MTLNYLITGVTGGLGAEVLEFFVQHIPFSEFAAASSKESSRKQFEDRGIAFRIVDYDDPVSLEASLKDVENFLFVSTNVFDNERRSRQHRNVIEAGKKVGVGHVWYTSLAFGGFSSDSKVAVQQAHLVTEKLLKESGITYTSIREGIYAEAFPLFLGWYPDTETVYLPYEGRTAFTSRAELGEATARLMIKGGHQNEIVLLTGLETVSFTDIVGMINEITGRQVKIAFVAPEEFVRLSAANDQGEKPASFFDSTVSWYDGLRNGDGEITDPLMGQLLGREPKGARDVICALLKENRDYTWHQNYADRERYYATLRKGSKTE